MVGNIAKQRLSPVQLLQQNDPRQFMRQSQRAEGDSMRGDPLYRWIETECASDDEAGTPGTVFRKPFKKGGKLP